MSKLHGWQRKGHREITETGHYTTYYFLLFAMSSVETIRFWCLAMLGEVHPAQPLLWATSCYSICNSTSPFNNNVLDVTQHATRSSRLWFRKMLPQDERCLTLWTTAAWQDADPLHWKRSTDAVVHTGTMHCDAETWLAQQHPGSSFNLLLSFSIPITQVYCSKKKVG